SEGGWVTGREDSWDTGAGGSMSLPPLAPLPIPPTLLRRTGRVELSGGVDAEAPGRPAALLVRGAPGRGRDRAAVPDRDDRRGVDVGPRAGAPHGRADRGTARPGRRARGVAPAGAGRRVVERPHPGRDRGAVAGLPRGAPLAAPLRGRRRAPGACPGRAGGSGRRERTG